MSPAQDLEQEEELVEKGTAEVKAPFFEKTAIKRACGTRAVLVFFFFGGGLFRWFYFF